MAPTRRANQDTSRVQEENNTRLSGAGGPPPNGPQPTIHLTPEELQRIIADAVKMATTKKATPRHESHPEQQHERPLEEERREEERESSTGSKSPTVAEELEELRKKVKVLEGQRWFEGLAPQNIRCFEDFQKVFLHQFSSSKKYKKTAFSLFEVKQRQDETLRAYLKRFNRVALDVPTCAPETKTTTFMQGLWEGDFFRSLTKKLPGNFEDLLSRAEKYINMEEVQNQKREALKRARGDRAIKTEDRAPKKNGSGHFSHVPLRVARDREIQECRSDEAPPPNSVARTPRPEQKGYCTLHKDCAHNTNECRVLGRNSNKHPVSAPHPPRDKSRHPPWLSRRPISNMPPKTVSTPSGRRGGDVSTREERIKPAERKDPSPSRGIIKMISGGSTDGDSNRARKARSRRECLEVDGKRRDEPVISFGPEDLRGVSLPHNDALVIQARVANYDVLRVFVDNGSSVNVIFKEALVQMDLHEYQLEAVETALFGFAGHAVYPEGEIALPLTLGMGDLRKTVMTTFTVVDAPSSYNVILGRPAMNEMKAVASTYHQKIKFPVREQVGEVKGDQPSSRRCYGETVRVDQKRARREGKEKEHQEETREREVHFVAEEEQEAVEIEPGKNVGWPEISAQPPGQTSCNLVDSTSGCELLSFLDAYQGYHQIPLALEDQDKASFTTSGGTFCYVVMPFGLKNAGATYQRLINLVFQKQIGRNIEVYVDDILIKTREVAHFIDDLAETFATLKQYRIKLNPAKCVFGVKSGKFLGFMVTDREIEVNPEKIRAIVDMPSPQSIRDVQKLTGRIAALSRFISRSAHRSYPFFQVLRKAQKFGWDDNCEQAFQDLTKTSG
ncbi:uncharacterized protein [Primulina eburnea]|uniref:uncharacterized protein n=1 Tax=Primulina eburnea TaxID=1245227 RepID=UPI003C6C461C